MFTSTAFPHALLEWQKNTGVDPKAFKSKLNADRPDLMSYFTYKNDGGKNASCYTATGRRLIISPDAAGTYTFVMNTWNTLPESYQQSMYNNSLAIVKRDIQQVESHCPLWASAWKQHVLTMLFCLTI
jgi:hypothetical protein